MAGLALLALAVSFGVLVLFAVLLPNATQTDKDFTQEYLLARAILDRASPYQPIDQLAARYVDPSGYFTKTHPTPHPPTVGLLALPLGLLSYSAAAQVWLAVELACLLGSVRLLTHERWARTLLFSVALVGWAPVTLELGLGQLTAPLLLGLAAVQVALSARRPQVGGGLLGLSLLIKPIAWPWLLVLLWRRCWVALEATVVVGLVGGAATILAIGLPATMGYLFDVLPRMTTAFFGEPTNISLWTLTSRLGITWLPGWAVPAAVLLVLAWIARRRASLPDQFALMTVASLLASPITWGFYLVLALQPLSRVLRALRHRGWQPPEVAAAIIVFATLSASQALLTDLALGGAGAGVLMEPALGLVLLAALLSWLTPSTST